MKDTGLDWIFRSHRYPLLRAPIVSGVFDATRRVRLGIHVTTRPRFAPPSRRALVVKWKLCLASALGSSSFRQLCVLHICSLRLRWSAFLQLLCVCWRTPVAFRPESALALSREPLSFRRLHVLHAELLV